MKNLHRYIIGFFLFAQTACSNSHILSPQAYTAWVESEDSGLHRHRTVGKIRYDLQYKPLEYIYLVERNNSKENIPFTERKKKLEGLQYYQLRIALDKGNADVMAAISSDDKDMYRRLSYLEFNFRKQIALIENGDSIPCALYHFQQYQGLTPYVDLVFAFKNNAAEKNSERTLFIDDDTFGAGPLYFEFPSEVFEQDTPINF